MILFKKVLSPVSELPPSPMQICTHMQAFQSICDSFCRPCILFTPAAKSELKVSFSWLLCYIIGGFTRESPTSCHLENEASGDHIVM